MSTKNRFTPGPWRHSYDKGYFVETVSDDEPDGLICRCEDLSNANLIAAAPDLYVAAENAALWIGGQPDLSRIPVLDELLLAILKAKGELGQK